MTGVDWLFVYSHESKRKWQKSDKLTMRFTWGLGLQCSLQKLNRAIISILSIGRSSDEIVKTSQMILIFPHNGDCFPAPSNKWKGRIWEHFKQLLSPKSFCWDLGSIRLYHRPKLIPSGHVTSYSTSVYGKDKDLAGVVYKASIYLSGDTDSNPGDLIIF